MSLFNEPLDNMDKERISSWELRGCMPEILNEIEVYGKSFIITRREQESAVMISTEDFSILEEVKSKMQKDTL